MRKRPGVGNFSEQNWGISVSAASFGCKSILRPRVAVVDWVRSGQPVQALPNVTRRFGLIGRTVPAGQVIVPAASSTVKSSIVNPHGTARLSGISLMIGVCPAAPIWARRSPLPWAESPNTSTGSVSMLVSAATRAAPQAASLFSAPNAFVNTAAVTRPLSGSIAMWALKPCCFFSRLL